MLPGRRQYADNGHAANPVAGSTVGKLAVANGDSAGAADFRYAVPEFVGRVIEELTMRTFTDTAGRAWTVTINVDAVRRVRKALDVNLLDLAEDKHAAGGRASSAI